MKESKIKKVKNYPKRKSRTGYFITGSKNAPARVRTRAERKAEQLERFRKAGEDAAYCVDILRGSMTDHFGFFAKKLYENAAETEAIVGMADECASCERQGLIRRSLTAFVSWLSKNYPKQ